MDIFGLTIYFYRGNICPSRITLPIFHTPIRRTLKMGKNLFNKVWDLHTVRILPNGMTQLLIGAHLVHEVTSPQAFDILRKRNLKVRMPGRTFATVDHIIPTDGQQRPYQDDLAEKMMVAIEDNAKEYGINFFNKGDSRQGIVHVIGAELGITQPGMTIACGDSHTSTHGAFGNIAFGIGTTQVADVLATQCLLMKRPKVRKIEINGALRNGVTAKDVVLFIICQLGVEGGNGYAYEFAGDIFRHMSMEERMTVCNMAIEGGALVGYVNPDWKTVKYLQDRQYSPKGKEFDKMERWWLSMASDDDAEYDDIVTFSSEDISEPMVTWGINPGQAVGISGMIPDDNDPQTVEALAYMKLNAGMPIKNTPIQVAFIGSCTNSRLSDLQAAAVVAKGRKVASGIKALVVPGSPSIKKDAEDLGLDKIFIEAGFEWREPGCSMCLAMNPDKLTGDEACASTSNRNFKGRQGSSTGRTFLMSPAMVAAAAIQGKIADVRELIGNGEN